MAAAGACWGAYSLAGRRSIDPLGATAATSSGARWPASHSSRCLSPSTSDAGVLLATASGSLASGVGYALVAALPSLLAWRAALIQTVVPVLTALAATAMLGETLSLAGHCDRAGRNGVY
jgi:drug/metabolite transporter (DMT)-like permease